MLIDVEPRSHLKLRDLHLDKRRLYHFNGSDPPSRDFKGYSSGDGLLVTLYKDKVIKMVYVPAEMNAAACANYYQRPVSFAQTYLVHVPVVTSVETQPTVKAGEKLKVVAHSNVNETRGYTWTITSGKIIAGQYTNEVTIDTTGLEGQTLIVTAEIRYSMHIAITGSCSVRVVPN